MATRAFVLGLLTSIALALVATAHADTVQVTRTRNRLCFAVTANAAGRAPGTTKNIHDFHVQIQGGQIISHSSPTNWNGQHSAVEASWETKTNPIRFPGGTRAGFCIRIQGGDHLTWWTTAKDGSKIAQGIINLP
jgi:hypothetical protein